MARATTNSRDEQARIALAKAHRNMEELARTRPVPCRRAVGLAGVARARKVLADARRR